MILVIGGYAQGKRAFVKEQFQIGKEQIFDGTLPEEVSTKVVVVDHFNDWVWKCLERKEEPWKIVKPWLQKHPDCIILSDEIGNGIIPLKEEERFFRDCMGRIQVEIAKQAKEVYRITCGISQKIK